MADQTPQDINEIQKVAAVAPSVKPVAKAAKELSLEEIQRQSAANELELQRLRLVAQQAEIEDLKARAEARELELQERRANLVDLKERLDERQLKRQSRETVFRGHGQNLLQDSRNRAAKQEACNHRKGGDGAAGVIGGQGDDMQYAIARHIMGNGDTWVRCLRCGKLWKPPVKSQHATVESYNAAMAIYKEALKFPTRNHTSGTHTFQWGEVINAQGQKEGGPEHYREKMKNVTLD